MLAATSAEKAIALSHAQMKAKRKTMSTKADATSEGENLSIYKPQMTPCKRFFIVFHSFSMAQFIFIMKAIRFNSNYRLWFHKEIPPEPLKRQGSKIRFQNIVPLGLFSFEKPPHRTRLVHPPFPVTKVVLLKRRQAKIITKDTTKQLLFSKEIVQTRGFNNMRFQLSITGLEGWMVCSLNDLTAGTPKKN